MGRDLRGHWPGTQIVFPNRALGEDVTRGRWEILAASAIGISAVALVLANPFNAQSKPARSKPATPPVAQTAGPSGPVQAVGPRIQVVFALDTTGSMGGLIQGAKQKIWSIANQLASGNPRPEVEMGLVAYRDIGDDYVTRIEPLTEDLDQVYEHLMAFQAGGGGDGPEHVNAALAAAIRQTPWSKDKDVLRLVFLVGDAPAHDEYDDGMTSASLAKEARRAGIVINTVRCGADGATERAWQQIAQFAGGRYASIAQDGGVVAIATPYDAELSRLNSDLADTVMGYGTAVHQAASARKMRRRKSMSLGAAASAAGYAAKSKKMNREDLVGAVERGVDLESVSEDELPVELKGLSLEARKEKIAEKQAERKRINQRILELSKKRDAHIRDATKKSKAKDGFDAQVLDMVREQTATIGVSYE